MRRETEIDPRRLIFSPRRDRDRDLPTFSRERDENETFEVMEGTKNYFHVFGIVQEGHLTNYKIMNNAYTF